jgi:hypothetical protein
MEQLAPAAPFASLSVHVKEKLMLVCGLQTAIKLGEA